MKSVKQSAGILLYRFRQQTLQFFLLHPGGPFWAKKDEGAWSIPKGEFEEEEPLAAAKREFEEETGMALKTKHDCFLQLSPVVLKSGKKIYAWACEGDVDENAVKSNFFEMEWPPKTGKKISVPEIDKAAWFTAEEGMKKINEKQAALITETARLIKSGKRDE